MIDDVCGFFLADEPPEKHEDLRERLYRPIFTYRWNREEDYNGYVLLEGSTVVGYIGAFFARRIVRGRDINSCNLTAWKVSPEHRGESLLLFFPFLKSRHDVITALTASRQVYPIYRKFGFRDLDTTIKVMPTWPNRGGKRPDGRVVTTDTDAVRDMLTGNDRATFDDHQPYDCLHMVVSGRDRHGYNVYTLSRKFGVPAAYFHHIADVELFLDNIDLVRRAMLSRHDALLVCVEERFLAGRRVPMCLGYRMNVPRLYRSESLAREDIDNLYSELVVLNSFKKKFY